MGKRITEYQKKVKKNMEAKILLDLTEGGNINILITNKKSGLYEEYKKFLSLFSLRNNMKNRNIFISTVSNIIKKKNSNALLKKLKGKTSVKKKKTPQK